MSVSKLNSIYPFASWRPCWLFRKKNAESKSKWMQELPCLYNNVNIGNHSKVPWDTLACATNSFSGKKQKNKKLTEPICDYWAKYFSLIQVVAFKTCRSFKATLLCLDYKNFPPKKNKKKNGVRQIPSASQQGFSRPQSAPINKTLSPYQYENERRGCLPLAPPP